MTANEELLKITKVAEMQLDIIKACEQFEKNINIIWHNNESLEQEFIEYMDLCYKKLNEHKDEFSKEFKK